MVMQTDLYSFHPLTLVLGVGSTKSNGEGDEDEELEELADAAWMSLLNETDGVYSLKPLEEVKANKVNVGRACRHLMRQAWGECYPIVNAYFLSLILVIQSNQAGRERFPGVKLTGNHLA
jgi:hypothetical protein